MSDATLRWQAQRIEELEETVTQLREQIAGTSTPHTEKLNELSLNIQRTLGLQPRSSTVLAILVMSTDSYVPRDDIYEQAGIRRQDEGATDKALSVHACLIRRRIGYGALETIHGRGFALTQEGRARVIDALTHRQERAP